MADGTLKVGTITTSSGSGTITLGQSGETVAFGSGVTSKMNQPAFQAQLSADQTVTNETVTKLQADTEDFDTDNCYDNSTNYRFTPNKAGKYKVYCMFSFDSTANDKNSQQQVRLYKNTTEVARSWQILTSNERLVVISFNFIIDMNGTSDYLELFGFLSVLSGGTPKFYTDTWWGAYRIGA